MNEQRRDILDMLAEGKITAEEAEQLIAALDRDRPPPAASSPDVRPKGTAKYLRLVVDSTELSELGKINVRVPLQLLRAGVRLAALVPPQALGKVNVQLNEWGLPFDLTQLKPGQLEEFVDQLDELALEIDQADSTVRVFCE